MWYRSPEMLTGERQYGREVDIWAAGCIMAEILLGKPLFQESSEYAMLGAITSLMGTQQIARVPTLREAATRFPNRQPSWRSKFTKPAGGFEFSALTDSGLDLLIKLLEPDPTLRITAAEAVRHVYFKERPFPQNLEFMPTAPDTNRSGELYIGTSSCTSFAVHRRRDSSEDSDNKVRKRVNAKRYIQQMASQLV
eukprot:Blabericola_migrator_1__2006@NODE_1548_length_4304_cov_95_805759_g590_i1_p3_GENE_NODE_1548_length_4304_cov_95_805759_g590_i1NODE_1548_length_4304_cov_95_805759_g590_i1_p3_ORF_typecomplete_len195_score27_84Pkinase/PF00069_25/5_5e17Pkinase_Tyr/PF07714_17/7_9e05Pkinase_Tyr/PF07714_17/4_7e03Pkinase_Tyr/PF07714_17/4_7e03_NODE_1548_length_4304_cov_95_805759_g590_i123802964